MDQPMNSVTRKISKIHVLYVTLQTPFRINFEEQRDLWDRHWKIQNVKWLLF